MTHSEIRHNRLACYDLAHPSKKSESYVIKFANGKTAEFTYKEENAPCLNLDNLDMPIDVIESLRGRESIQFLFSSSWDHFGEKPHSEKIALCEKWVDESEVADNTEWMKRYSDEAGKLIAKAETYQKTANYLYGEMQRKKELPQ
jgi:hypothetical protein